MIEDKNESFCENSNITQSEEYKEFSRDIFLNTALESSGEFHHLSMMAIHEELIDELYDRVREEKPSRGDTEKRITEIMKKEHGITYSLDEAMVEMKAIETDICLANELVEDPHTIFNALPRREFDEIDKDSEGPNSKNPLTVASQVDPEHQKDTGTACQAAVEGLTTGVVQDSMNEKTDTPSHGLSVEVKCIESDLPSK